MRNGGDGKENGAKEHEHGKARRDQGNDVPQKDAKGRKHPGESKTIEEDGDEQGDGSKSGRMQSPLGDQDKENQGDESDAHMDKGGSNHTEGEDLQGEDYLGDIVKIGNDESGRN